jgi:hypothetical protein
MRAYSFSLAIRKTADLYAIHPFGYWSDFLPYHPGHLLDPAIMLKSLRVSQIRSRCGAILPKSSQQYFPDNFRRLRMREGIHQGNMP